MIEHFFQCPHCWETISFLIDRSIEKELFIEDCEVCCNPIEVNVVLHEGELESFNLKSIEQ